MRRQSHIKINGTCESTGLLIEHQCDHSWGLCVCTPVDKSSAPGLVGESAGFRTRRDARYNRAVVPWWWTDCSPGDPHCGGTQNPQIHPQLRARPPGFTAVCRRSGPDGCVGRRTAERGPEVRREGREQYARVCGGSVCQDLPWMLYPGHGACCLVSLPGASVRV